MAHNYEASKGTDPWAVPQPGTTNAGLPERVVSRRRRATAGAAALALAAVGAYAWLKPSHQQDGDCVVDGKSFTLAATDVQRLLIPKKGDEATWATVDADVTASLKATPGAQSLRGIKITTISNGSKTDAENATAGGWLLASAIETHLGLDPRTAFTSENDDYAGQGNMLSDGDAVVTPVAAASCDTQNAEYLALGQ